jgi:regulator of sigma E protease
MDDDNPASSARTSEAMAQMTPEQRAGSFHAKPLWQRAAVVAAGPIANFLLAMVIFLFTFWLVGTYSTAAYVDEVLAGSPAERAGLKPGDKVTEVDGWAVKTFSDMQRLISTNPGRALAIVVERDRLPQRLTVTPEAKEVTDPIGNKVQIGQIGIRRVTGNERWERTRHGLVESAGMAVRETWLTTYQIITSLPKIPAAVARIFTGQKQSELGGPLAIAEMSAHAAKGGLLAMLSWIAPLSVMLAVMNLLPIPPLDGGHLMFYAYEGAAGRPLNEKLYEYALKIGFAVLLTLMVAATYSDVMRNVLRLFGQS